MKGRTIWGELSLELPQELEDETTIVLRGTEPPMTVPLRLTKSPTVRPAFVCKRTTLGPTPPTLEQLAAVETQVLMSTASGSHIHSRDVEVVGGRETLIIEASFDTPTGRIRQVHATTIIGRAALSFAATALDDVSFPSVRATLLAMVGSAELMIAPKIPDDQARSTGSSTPS